MARVINPALYVLGQNAAMWLNFATPSAVKVLGLQGMGLGIGFSQTSIDVVMMGQRIAPKAFTGASYDDMTSNANYIPGDPSQAALQRAALQGTILKNIRMYLKDKCNFSAPDQISSAGGGGGLTTGTSGLNVGSFGDPSIGAPSEIFSNSVTFAPAGPFTVFVAHTPLGDGPSITVAAQAGSTEATITLGSGTWDALGFDALDTIIVDGNGDVPKYAQCESVTDAVMTLTLDAGDVALLTSGVLASLGQVHAATPMEVSELDLTC